MRRRSSRAVLAVVFGLLSMFLIATALTGAAGAAVRLTAELNGAEEAPGPGDPDGVGWASMTFYPDTGRICYSLRVRNIAGATAAHIHRGAFGVAGPVVVHLSPPNRGGSSGSCTDADPALVAEILANPEGFYVNVHNPTYPAGAVRGQLFEDGVN